MSQYEMREADLRFYGGEELSSRWEWAKDMERSTGRPALIYFANPSEAPQVKSSDLKGSLTGDDA